VSEANDPRDFRFRYDALIREVYDGDTCFADVDLGLDTWKHGVALRLFGIDTPELRGSSKVAGYAARDFVCAALSRVSLSDVAGFKKKGRRLVLPEPVPIFLHSHGDDDGKYGRLLSTVWFYDDVGGLIALNGLLLTHGHATIPSY
jgi:micrococcal nuclease